MIPPPGSRAKRRYTRADLVAFIEDVRKRAAEIQAENKQRGRPDLRGPAALEDGMRRWRAVFEHIDAVMVVEGRSIGEALDSAAEKFHKSRKAIEKAWSKWGEPLTKSSPRGPNATLDDVIRYTREVLAPQVLEHCTPEEIRSALVGHDPFKSGVKLRRLCRLAERRAVRSAKNQPQLKG